MVVTANSKREKGGYGQLVVLPKRGANRLAATLAATSLAATDGRNPRKVAATLVEVGRNPWAQPLVCPLRGGYGHWLPPLGGPVGRNSPRVVLAAPTALARQGNEEYGVLFARSSGNQHTTMSPHF